MKEANKAEIQPQQTTASLKSFFENTPPDTYVVVNDLKVASSNHLESPVLTLFCEGEHCNGPRLFVAANFFYNTGWQQQLVKYTCNNCRTRAATFAIMFRIDAEMNGLFVKLGQMPAFGPVIPAKLISLIGPDRELFLQGRKAESRGLGIGAFAYYRRVVENQKSRIISEIAKVARKVGSSTESIQKIEHAQAERQFSSSVELVKDALPQTLLIDGHNPLTLLHSALSRGLHDVEMTDARCLILAQSIRTLLTDLAERIAESLRNTAELRQAVSTLLQDKESR